ncbi:MAG: succinate dehydrogenase cytochrome b subunit [Bacteroidales bacterium]|nr:succinate dehydrogenase cytochrome b subunit [Bacteroidales bacterium]
MSSSALTFSSVTKKIVMSLMGLFLIIFLLVHLTVNLFLLFDPTRELFNVAAHFMATNPVLKIMEISLFAGFIIHILFGLILQIQNWLARPKRYKVEGYSHTSFFSKFMIHTGIVILIFLVLHLLDFYFKLKFGDVPNMIIHGHEYPDMGLVVIEKFSITSFIIIYIIALIILGFHLHHAFQSAFQSLGLNHTKYTPVIKALGTIYSIVVALGFIIIPLYIYFY